MELGKKTALFAIGGGAYCGLELLWRGWSHWSMFLLGGLCFVLIGSLKLPWLPRMLAGAVICTMGELLFGMIFNSDYRIWDYRGLPLNWGGQICLPFTALWFFISGAAMWLYDRCERLLHSD